MSAGAVRGRGELCRAGESRKSVRHSDRGHGRTDLWDQRAAATPDCQRGEVSHCVSHGFVSSGEMFFADICPSASALSSLRNDPTTHFSVGSPVSSQGLVLHSHTVAIDDVRVYFPLTCPVRQCGHSV